MRIKISIYINGITYVNIIRKLFIYLYLMIYINVVHFCLNNFLNYQSIQLHMFYLRTKENSVTYEKHAVGSLLHYCFYSQLNKEAGNSLEQLRKRQISETETVQFPFKLRVLEVGPL